MEIFFRTIIPACERPFAIYDTDWKLIRYDPRRDTSGHYSAGNLAQLRKPWRINNYGWNSEIDYQPTRTGKRRTAVIGDSFVEAFQVAPKDHFASVLRRELGDNQEVYTFGFSGSPMSHYLQMSRYVNETFSPDTLVFNIVQNDFHQSLCEVRYPPGMLCYNERDGKFVEGEVTPYVPNTVKRIARHSAIVRYWYHNLGGRINWRFLTSEFDSNPQRYVEGGAVVLRDDTEELKRLRARIDDVVGVILNTLRKESPQRRIILTLDTIQIYNVEDIRKTPQWWMHEILEKHAAENNIELVDLAFAFKAHFEATGERIESPYDSHWNETGHKVVGMTLLPLLAREPKGS